MNEPGDVVTVYGNPKNNTFKIGDAKLIKKVKGLETLELWKVEFADENGGPKEAFIKKLSNGEE